MEPLPSYGFNPLENGAKGDGRSDDYPVFDRLLDRDGVTLTVPPGTYLLSRPLRLRSGTRILAHPSAHFLQAPGLRLGVRDALVTNADWENGNQDIEISGGKWDGNNTCVHRAEEDERDGYTGNLFLFRNVKDLNLTHLHLKDPLSYFVCMGAVQRFLVDDVRFEITHHTRNQDGIHVSGFCSDGMIRNIRGYGKYCPGDDLVALNADDALDRSETRSALAGPIRNIRVENLFAEDCHAFVRLATVWSEISDVDIHNLKGGCVDVAINADSLRFCRSPLFDKDDPRFAMGCGNLRNIRIRDLEIHKTRPLTNGIVQLHSRMNNVTVENFVRDFARDAAPDAPSLDIAFTPGAKGFLESVSPMNPKICGEQSTNLQWQSFHLSGQLPGVTATRTEFLLKEPSSRLRGNFAGWKRCHVSETPIHPLPEPNWNRGMQV